MVDKVMHREDDPEMGNILRQRLQEITEWREGLNKPQPQPQPEPEPESLPTPIHSEPSVLPLEQSMDLPSPEELSRALISMASSL